jgi:hypothetical protein
MTTMMKMTIVYVQFVLEKEISFGKQLAMVIVVE